MDENELWHVLQEKIALLKKQHDPSEHLIIEKTCDALKETIENYFREQISFSLPHPHPRSRVYRSEPKNWEIIETSSNEILSLILKKARKCELPPACVFDLDGTLFDVGYRTLGILKEWLTSEHAGHFDKRLQNKIAKLNYSHIGYSLSHAFENAGFDLRNQEIMSFFSSVERTWKKKFFDGNSLLKYDHVMENSQEFVNKLHSNGIQIFYLTGRYLNTMSKGTLEQISKFNFPLDVNKNNVILKEHMHADDQIFKSEKIKEISEKYTIVGNFENEYLNIAYMALEVPNAINVIVDSHHSGRPTPHLEFPIYRIFEYSKIL